MTKKNRNNPPHLADKPRIHLRDHDGGRIRIWTDMLRDYGAFEIVNRSEVEALITINNKMSGLLTIQVHHCDGGECNCPCLCADESLSELL